MKKLLCLMLTLTLLLTVPALADSKVDLTDYAIANANVSAVSFVDIVAPCSGTLETFDLAVGDRVTAEQVLMNMDTTKLYATENGTCKAIFAEVGDDASAVVQRYGALLGIEPTTVLVLNATTSGAYNDEKNRILHLGETLYFQSTKNKREEGYGRVVAVNGESYQVEVLSGDFDPDECMNLYRGDDYASKDCVGKGDVVRRASLLVSGTGRVSAIHVSEGDAIEKGQLLMELLGADAAPDASSAIAAPSAGVVSSVQVAPGQQVWKGEMLARIELDEELEVVAEVDEMDLGALSVGDTLPVTLDMNESNVITGTVTEISALGVTKQNAAYFTVHVSIPRGTGLLGASASVYLPRE